MTQTTLATLAAMRRIDTLEDIASHVRTQPPTGEAEFVDALRALLLCGVQGIEIARMLGVESSCITRWTRNGVTPHHIGRKAYAAHLPRIAQRQIDALRDEHGIPAPQTLMAEAA